jgi:hypothetical protein
MRFTNLNFILSGANRLEGGEHRTPWLCWQACRLMGSLRLQAGNLRRATWAGGNRKAEVMQFDDRRYQA